MHDNGSKIGIGTADPLHAFHVHNGNFMVTGGTSIGGPMILFGGGTTLTGPGADYNGMWGIEYEPTDGGLNFWKPNPNPSGSGNYFLFLSNNGNIGIGTNIPSQKLEVNGNIKFTDNGEISSYSNNHRILFRRFENKMEFREYGDIIFSPGATAGLETSRMVFNANGNAGFGINSPQTKIHMMVDQMQILLTLQDILRLAITELQIWFWMTMKLCRAITVHLPVSFCKTPEEMLVSIVMLLNLSLLWM